MMDPTPRFMAKVKVARSGCWLWRGAVKQGGLPYGRFRLWGKIVKAHRAAWLLFVGPIPAGRCGLHRCDVPRCVSPAHLFLGTIADNVADMLAKGRGRDGCAR